MATVAPPKTITSQTNAACGIRKVSTEKALLAVGGVKDAELDLTTEEVTVAKPWFPTFARPSLELVNRPTK
jgi:hypothetical protein